MLFTTQFYILHHRNISILVVCYRDLLTFDCNFNKSIKYFDVCFTLLLGESLQLFFLIMAMPYAHAWDQTQLFPCSSLKMFHHRTKKVLKFS